MSGALHALARRYSPARLPTIAERCAQRVADPHTPPEIAQRLHRASERFAFYSQWTAKMLELVE